MNHDPISSTPSKFDDTSATGERIARPAQVLLAIRLAVIGYALGLLSIAISWDEFSRLHSIGHTISNQLFSLALCAWIYYKIYAGRNWARMTLLVVYMLGVAAIPSRVVTGVFNDASTLEKIELIVGLTINAITLWLLFSSPGRYWFRQAATGLPPNTSLERARDR